MRASLSSLLLMRRVEIDCLLPALAAEVKHPMRTVGIPVIRVYAVIDLAWSKLPARRQPVELLMPERLDGIHQGRA